MTHEKEKPECFFCKEAGEKVVKFAVLAVDRETEPMMNS